MAALTQHDSARPVLRLDFTDFWADFCKTDNYFYSLLSKHYNVILCDKPDFLIYSGFGKTHRRYTCTKIFWTGENYRPNFDDCDYAFSFDYNSHPRHYRFPLYGYYHDPRWPEDPRHPQRLVEPKPPAADILARKSKFCCALISNDRATERINFMKRLSRYKKVDSGGRAHNNIGYVVPEKINGKNGKLEFIKDYKFVISFENSSYPGYTTEKVFEPMLVNSIPLYWGNPLVGRDFNTASFVNLHDFKNEEEAISRIVELDRDDAAFQAMLEQPWFHGNTVNEFIREENVVRRFQQIFTGPQPGSLRRGLRAAKWQVYEGLPRPLQVSAAAVVKGLHRITSG